MQHRQLGITLIELLTVIIVIAILASVAVPSYRNYLIRTQRTEARTALLQLQAAQEKFYLDNNRYTDNVSDPRPEGLGLSGVTETGKYRIRIELDAGGQRYTAVAEPAPGGGQEDDTDCGTLTVTDTGVRGIRLNEVDGDDAAAAECWR